MHHSFDFYAKIITLAMVIMVVDFLVFSSGAR